MDDFATDCKLTPTAITSTGRISFRSKKILRSSSPGAKPSKMARVLLPVLAQPLSTPGEVASALLHLATADSHLASLIKLYEPPSFHKPSTPFLSLTRSILYQQLATKSAASIYARFLSLCGGEDSVVPDVVLALTPLQLRQVGVSSRKTSYIHDLASKYQSGFLSDSAIFAMDDSDLFSKLTAVKGIGPWTVHMFMIFSLHRPDVLPVGDLGVRKGVQILLGLSKIPQPEEMEELCKLWSPYRSAGAWYMWRLVESNGKAAISSS